MIALLLTAAFAQDNACVESTDTLQVLAAIERAENAWSMADRDNFLAANEAMALIVPCLADPLTRSMAARIHRMNGLNAFLSQDDPSMELSLSLIHI